ncbi:MAG: nodulation protein NodZ [bacterium]
MSAVVVKGSGGGGLGDSIRAVLAGIAYSIASDRMLYVDWSHGVLSESGVNAFSHLFSLHNVATIQTLPEDNNVYPEAWKDRLSFSLDSIYQQDGAPPWNRSAAIRIYSFDFSRLDYSERVLVMWDFDQIDKLKWYFSEQESIKNAFASEAYILKKHLRPAPAICAKVEQEWSKFGGGPMIGLHARSTHEFARNKGSICMDQYLSAVGTALSRQPQANIFVASDNADCIEKILEHYPHAIIRNKWLASPGQSLHLNSNCPNKLQAAKDGLIEMLILARCDQIVCPANSSFSRTARLMGDFNADDETLLLPERSFLERILSRIRQGMRQSG